jgi:acyl-CoA thioesterase FadM
LINDIAANNREIIFISYRSPVFPGEVLTVEARTSGIGRSSFRMEYRITAPDSVVGRARLVALSSCVLTTYDYVTEGPMPVPAGFVAALEAFEGRPLRD